MSVFILSDHESLTTRIQEIFSFSGHPCPLSNVLPVDDGIKKLGREPEISLVLVVLAPDTERVLMLLPTLAKLAPRKVIAIGPTSDARLVLRALRSGAVDFVETSELEVDLLASIERLRAADDAPH